MNTRAALRNQTPQRAHKFPRANGPTTKAPLTRLRGERSIL
jgi:hypothetical protein